MERDIFRQNAGLPSNNDDSAADSIDMMSSDPCKNPDSLDIFRKFNQLFSDQLSQIEESPCRDHIEVYI